MNATQLEELLKAGLPQARVAVRSEDDTHFEAVVVSETFAGLPRLRRHQAVYRVLGDKMGGEIHALSLRTLTPDEAAAERRGA